MSNQENLRVFATAYHDGFEAGIPVRYDYFLYDSRFDSSTIYLSEQISTEAYEFIRKNRLAEGLSLRQHENTIFHSMFVIEFAKRRIKEKMEKSYDASDYQKVALGFERYLGVVISNEYPEGESLHRLQSIEIAVEELTQYEKLGSLISNNDILPRDYVVEWIARWQPLIWQELPVPSKIFVNDGPGQK